MTRTPFIAGNWKLNLDHLQAIALVQKLAWTLSDAHHRFDEVEVAVFPPFTDLRSVQTLITADKLEIGLGAQDLSVYDDGAHTGEISGAFLRRLECRYVIVGHSERRRDHGETDAVVAAKAAAAVRHDLVPVICVGESAEQRAEDATAAVLTAQVQAAVNGLPADAEIVIAYEPLWAIGAGEPATPAQAQAAAAVVRQALGERGDAARVLYGGSVDVGTVAPIMRGPDVDGVLVGSASLDAKRFADIARYRAHVNVG
jgi:triosephosphate isomerase